MKHGTRIVEKKGEKDGAGCCKSTLYLQQLVATFAVVTALLEIRAANAPAKVFGALAVNGLLHPEVRLGANNYAIFHSSLSHGCVSKPEIQHA